MNSEGENTDSEAPPGERKSRVALVSMPFASTDVPSIQLGLLAALGRARGFEVDTFHLNLELSAEIPALYKHFVEFDGSLIGDWLFAKAAFGDSSPPASTDYLERAAEQLPSVTSDELLTIRDYVIPSYLERCLAENDWGAYGVIGFSSSFQQNTASLALMRLLKSRWPEVVNVIGGANVAGSMGHEILRAFSWVDAVCLGEGDRSFVEFLDWLEAGRQTTLPSNIIVRGFSHPAVNSTALFDSLDNLPTPNYEEYFERRRRLGFGPVTKPVPFEASRGCWWGAKNHCVFCGLNAEGMAFRTKSGQRVLLELDELSSQYKIRDFMATDNILDHKHIVSVFGEIAKEKKDLRFFLEVKANLRPEQLRQLRDGGVRWVQPGIESLDTHLLSLMKKGVSLLQNVRFLRWSRYYGIRAAWNILWGFPGEVPEDYARLSKILPLLRHLEPPHGFHEVRVDRFSPMFSTTARGGDMPLLPIDAYSHVYPEAVRLADVAYYFENSVSCYSEEHGKVDMLVEDWKNAWEVERDRPYLSFRKVGGHLIILDRRDGETKQFEIEGLDARIYEACVLTERGFQQLAEDEEGGGRLVGSDSSEILRRLRRLCDAGLMLEDKGLFLSLAIPVNSNW